MSSGPPWNVAVALDGVIAYVVNKKDLRLIDTTTRSVVATIDVGTFPWDLVISPDGTRITVIDAFENDLKIVDAESRTVIQSVAVGKEPGDVAFSPDGLTGLGLHTPIDILGECSLYSPCHLMGAARRGMTRDFCPFGGAER
jgi:YVTN family beta-propeller protein